MACWGRAQSLEGLLQLVWCLLCILGVLLSEGLAAEVLWAGQWLFGSLVYHSCAYVRLQVGVD